MRCFVVITFEDALARIARQLYPTGHPAWLRTLSDAWEFPADMETALNNLEPCKEHGLRPSKRWLLAVCFCLQTDPRFQTDPSQQHQPDAKSWWMPKCFLADWMVFPAYLFWELNWARSYLQPGTEPPHYEDFDALSPSGSSDQQWPGLDCHEKLADPSNPAAIAWQHLLRSQLQSCIPANLSHVKYFCRRIWQKHLKRKYAKLKLISATKTKTMARKPWNMRRLQRAARAPEKKAPALWAATGHWNCWPRGQKGMQRRCCRWARTEAKKIAAWLKPKFATVEQEACL